MVSQTELQERAIKVMPGGVNSPVRAWKAVGGNPVFIERGEGPYLWDTEGKRYIDYVGAYGPLILGHAHPAITEAIMAAARKGTAYGGTSEGEVALAEAILEPFSFCDQIRLVNSGTEATMSAVRLARAATGRDIVIKMQGCYHGHADGFLVDAGSGALQHGVPSSPGVPEGAARETLTIPYNNLNAAKALFEERGQDIACLICEPVAGNMGVVPPDAGYLEGLRNLTKDHGALLIFDEVMTGFRVAYGGWAVGHNLSPDLVCLGKVIGGGLPVGAYAGPAHLMEKISPAGPVYQAGTLSGNPLAVAAGRATLDYLKCGHPYETLGTHTARLANGIKDKATAAGVPIYVQHVTGMLSFFFSEKPVLTLADVKESNTNLFGPLFHGLVERGVIMAPSAYEAMFLSVVHTDEVIEETIDAFEGAFNSL